MKKLLALYILFFVSVIGIAMMAFPFYAMFNRVSVWYSVGLLLFIPVYSYLGRLAVIWSTEALEE